jgi:hypothetical protein
MLIRKARVATLLSDEAHFRTTITREKGILHSDAKINPPR